MSKVQIVWFRDLKLWSVALQNQTTLKSHFPLIELKEILVDLTEHRKITILDNEFYKEPTISSKTNEISIRKSGLGSEFKVKKRVKILKGDLVIAKMHTQNGLYAFANDEFASTTTFIPFKILENKINKNYLFILLKQTLARLQKFDSVNRETYKTDEILSLQIPLPPLEIQKQIVAKIESIKAQIKALQVEEKRLKDEIEAYIYIALGLEKKQEAKRQKVFIVRFKDLDRWDTRHNQSIAINLCHTDSIPYHTKQPNCHTDSIPCHTDTTSTCHTETIAEVSTNIESKTRFFAVAQNDNKSKKDISAQYDKPINTANLKALLDSIPTPPPHGWEVKTLGEICEIINRNWHKYYKNETFPYIQISNVTQKGIDGYSLIHYDNAPSRAKTLVKTGELLISLTRPNLGAFAVVEQEYNNFVVSSGFAVVDSKNIVTNHYIKHILQSQIGIDIFNQIMSGALYPAISQGDLQNLKIPLPPLKVQEKIVAHIHKIESSIATTQEKAKALELELPHYIESTL